MVNAYLLKIESRNIQSCQDSACEQIRRCRPSGKHLSGTPEALLKSQRKMLPCCEFITVEIYFPEEFVGDSCAYVGFRMSDVGRRTGLLALDGAVMMVFESARILFIDCFMQKWGA